MNEVKRTYKIARGWQIFSYILIPPLTVLFIWLAYYFATMENQDQIWLTIFMVSLFLAMTFGLIIGLYDMYKARFIIYPDKFVKINWNKSREIPFVEVDGYDGNDNNYVFIFPKGENRSKITISRYTERNDEWLYFIRENFENLPQKRKEEQFEELMSDQAFGDDEPERLIKLNKIKKLTFTINGLGWASFIWLWFYPHPYKLAVLASIVIPTFALLVLISYKGLIKLWNETGSYPSLTYAFIIPPMALMVRMLLDYDIFEYQNAWIYSFVITPVIYLLVLKAIPKPFIAVKLWIKVSNYFFTGVFIGLIVFQASLAINCTFDDSVPNVYEVEVLDKSIHKGKYTTDYNLIISVWERTTEPMEVSVTKSEYERIEPGDEVDLYLKKGLLNIPWVYAKAGQ